MFYLITKEIKDFWNNVFGISALGVLVIATYLVLWVFEETGYLSFGLAEGDLYFQYLSYLMLFIVPAFSVGFLANEYSFGTEELLRSLSLDWNKVITAKFIAAFIILLFLLLLTSFQLFVVYDLSLTPQSLPIRQIAGSYIGLAGLGACFIGISLMITSFVEQTAASFILSIFVCFMFYSGFALIGEIELFTGSTDLWMDRLSLSYHSEQISRGILRFSSIIYLIGLCAWTLWLSAHRLNTKEI